MNIRLTLAAISLLPAALAASCTPPAPQAVLATAVGALGEALNTATEFTADTPRIFCSVGTAGLPAAAEIRARWETDSSGAWKALKEESRPAAAGAWLAFALDAPENGFAAGNYRVDLAVSGRDSVSKAFRVALNPSQPLPSINSFMATPDSVTAGQPLTLSWNISGATRATLSPGIGSVEAGGSRTVYPAAGTTYTLTALNSAGPSSKALTVKVLPVPAGAADLAVVDLFRQASMVYYTVLNRGTLSSQPSSSSLYVLTGNPVTSGYVPPLAPGEQRTLYFGTFSWTYIYDTPASACVDTRNENGPDPGPNRCLTRVLPGSRGL